MVIFICKKRMISVKIIQDRPDNNVLIKIYDEIGYFLYVVGDNETANLYFYINNEISVHDGIRVFNMTQLLKYKEPLMVMFEEIYKLKLIKENIEIIIDKS